MQALKIYAGVSAAAMAHAALGLLLTKDCTQKVPAVSGNCEKGVRSLLKAGLKTTPAELCGKFTGSAPAWDWAFPQSCGGRESPAQPSPVIRPGEILRRYLDLELSGLPR